MLAKLAFGNIRRNFRTYWAYFFTAAFGVFVLYLFLSIVYGRATQSAASFQSTKVLFGIGAVLTAVFVAFFIWYSNSFFIKARKKEFATYMLLGMSKKQMTRLALLENLTILALAYAVGIAAGMLINKLLIMLLFYSMQEKATVPFEFCLPAFQITSFIYLGVFLLIAAHSAILLNKTSLIALINASRKAERGMKISWLTWVIGVLAILFMGFGYFLALAAGGNAMLWPVIVLFVCIGTGLLFLGLATLFFHFMRKNEAGLYRGGRLVTVSQLMHRYRGNVGVLSVIAITTSVALCAVMCCCGLSIKAEDNAHSVRPFSLEYIDGGASAGAIVDAALRDHPEVAERARVSFTLIKAHDAGAQGEALKPFYYVMGESAYNEIMRAQGRREVAVSAEGQCLLVQYSNISNTYDDKLTDARLAIGTETLTLGVEGWEQNIFCSLDRFRRTFVVKDSEYERFLGTEGTETLKLAGLELKEDMAADRFVVDLRARMAPEHKLSTFYENYRDNIKMTGVLMFVGVFIGLLFIVATGSILYFRMAMEAAEDRERFVTLRRIGMSAAEIRSSIASGLAIIFGAPLVVAAANTLAAMTILDRMINFSMLDTYLIILAVYTGLYALYYLLTLNKYVKTVVSGA